MTGQQQASARTISLRTFAVLWALSVIAHFWFIDPLDVFESVERGIHFLVFSLAYAVLFSGGNFYVLLGLAALQLCSVWIALPDVSNHWLLSGFVNITLLLSAAVSYFRTGASSLERETARVFVPPARTICVILYGFACFWKLNPLFLDAKTSCAVEFFRHIRVLHPFLPAVNGFWQELLMAAPVLIEGLLVLLLTVPSLRVLGVLIGVLYHAVLLFDVHQQLSNFSTVMFALLFLFVIEETARFSRLFLGALDRLIKRAVPPLLAFAFLLIYVGGTLSPRRASDWWFLNQQILLSMYAGGLVVFTFRLCWWCRGRSQRQLHVARGGVPRFLWLLPLLAFVNGIAPVLGLKTGSSWQMYSNLKIEGRAINHFFAYRSLDVLGYFEDSVEILEVRPVIRSNNTLRFGEIVPFFALARYCTESRCSTLHYRRKEQEVTSDGNSERHWYQNQSLIKRKFLRFVLNAHKGGCYW